MLFPTSAVPVQNMPVWNGQIVYYFLGTTYICINGLCSYWLVLLPTPLFFFSCVCSFFSLGQFNLVGRVPLSCSASQSPEVPPFCDVMVFISNYPRCTQIWSSVAHCSRLLKHLLNMLCIQTTSQLTLHFLASIAVYLPSVKSSKSPEAPL